jgi:hypothetical protein
MLDRLALLIGYGMGQQETPDLIEVDRVAKAGAGLINELS